MSQALFPEGAVALHFGERQLCLSAGVKLYCGSMMQGQRRVAVAAAAMTPVRKDLEAPIADTLVQVIHEALARAGIGPVEVEGLYTTPPGFARPSNFMFACDLAAHLGVPFRGLVMAECGGSSSLAALKAAIQDVLAGRVRVAVAAALDQRALPSADQLLKNLPMFVSRQIGLYGPYLGPYGIGAPIPLYALSAQRYMHEYRVSAEAVAEVAVRLRRNAEKNPFAEYRDPITVEQVLASPLLSPPIHLLECSPFASGAAAVVLCAKEAAAGRKLPPVWLTGFGEYHHPSHFLDDRAGITTFEATVKAGAEAFADAGRKPSDVDVAEVYGVFAATELMIYEDLGFFPKGEAGRAVAEGRTGPEGEVWMNPSGGRLSFGHPAAATPMMELTEVAWQLQGRAAERQAKKAGIGLVHSEHGMLNGGFVFILEN